mmetsp:Transcript_92115/g.163964  ORF Transcript_92115/g.163964 Transcript_92115/m.163964 type:complete len:564 (-) Transcript_92115:280-1971(-)|eukprot:CAMPEP_0197628656 /NCGR_PEP_ID=MMETSP1338-20131121/6866_1 /TAXON_ID=43686 ORGANISM="Pelagodinium beii, Strain RCC1491" /NCGR_SAMPLE_ID=MMETSP1338 /ASSEMBLY_ACC=CAM_ASM_000754 /LENGTH=563 /DNA_ID=CAMNT_0043199645 /DNA_START=65 /DNA_END=1756 /DNA_ORIENTATION=+
MVNELPPELQLLHDHLIKDIRGLFQVLEERLQTRANVKVSGQVPDPPLQVPGQVPDPIIIPHGVKKPPGKLEGMVVEELEDSGLTSTLGDTNEWSQSESQERAPRGTERYSLWGKPSGDVRRTSIFSMPEEADEKQVALKKAGAMGGVDGKRTEKLDEELYDVTNLYKETGWAQSIARSSTFEKITLAVISVNAIYIGVDADNNKAETLLEAPVPFQVSDHLFCAFFSFELMVRFLAFQMKRDCLRDAWFVFDSCLVGLMVFETWLLTALLAASGGAGNVSLPTGPLRLLRLLRLSRLVRLLRSMPDLVVLVNGIRAAVSAVSSSLILVIVANYVFAIILHMFLKDIPEMELLFDTIGNSMWTLAMDGTFLDNVGSTLAKLRFLEDFGYDWTTGWTMIIVFSCYLLLTAITVMNMLIGVLCEVVSAVKKRDEEKIAVDFMKMHLRGVLQELDTDGNGTVSGDELEVICNAPLAVQVLEELEIAPQDLVDLSDIEFEKRHERGEEKEITREELLEKILVLRGNRDISASDFVHQHADLRRLIMRLAKGLSVDMMPEVKESATID